LVTIWCSRARAPLIHGRVSGSAAPSACRSAGCTSSPASPNLSGSTGFPRPRRAAIASFAASVAETGISRTSTGGQPAGA